MDRTDNNHRIPECAFSVHIEGDATRLNINMHDAVESE